MRPDACAGAGFSHGTLVRAKKARCERSIRAQRSSRTVRRVWQGRLFEGRDGARAQQRSHLCAAESSSRLLSRRWPRLANLAAQRAIGFTWHTQPARRSLSSDASKEAARPAQSRVRVRNGQALGGGDGPPPTAPQGRAGAAGARLPPLYPELNRVQRCGASDEVWDRAPCRVQNMRRGSGH